MVFSSLFYLSITETCHILEKMYCKIYYIVEKNVRLYVT